MRTVQFTVDQTACIEDEYTIDALLNFCVLETH